MLGEEESSLHADLGASAVDDQVDSARSTLLVAELGANLLSLSSCKEKVSFCDGRAED